MFHDSSRPVERIAIAFRPDGRALAVYSDTFPFEALGVIRAMPRAGNVEWDAAGREWVARDARTHEIVARGRARDAVLRAEHEHYVDEILLGHLL